jgi:hypothetical protein
MKLTSAKILQVVLAKPGQTRKEIWYEVRDTANMKTVHHYLRKMAEAAMIRCENKNRPHTFYPL